MSRRPLLTFAAAALLASCTASPSTHPTAAPTSTKAVHCGYERWHVKVGSDPAAGQVNLTPTLSTIAALTALTSPLPPVTGKYPPQTPRQPIEEQTVTVGGTLIAYDIEQDDDFHLVLMDDAGRSMIVEIPGPACVPGSSPFAAGISRARAAFITATGYNPPEPPPGQYAPAFVQANQQVTVTGVVFFDFIHGQNGVASNGVELHPVLDIHFGSSPGPTDSPSPSPRPSPRPTHHRHHHRG